MDAKAAKELLSQMRDSMTKEIEELWPKVVTMPEGVYEPGLYPPYCPSIKYMQPEVGEFSMYRAWEKNILQISSIEDMPVEALCEVLYYLQNGKGSHVQGRAQVKKRTWCKESLVGSH